MGQNDTSNQSFESILREKLGKASSFNEQHHEFSSINNDQSGVFSSESLWEKLADLGLSKTTIKPTTKSTFAYSKETAKKTQKTIVAEKKFLWRPIGLPADITAAFEFFIEHGAQVTDKSSAQELKRAYRRLAKTLHPDAFAQASELDQQRQAKLFRELKLHYLVLSK